MKSKRVLGLLIVLTFTVVSILGCFNVAAEDYTQRVALKEYQPPVKTLLYDDDFDDCQEDGTRTVTSAYNYSSSSSGKAIVDDADGGKAMQLNNSSNYMTFNNVIDSDKLVVSFDMYCATQEDNTHKMSFTLSNKSKKMIASSAWKSSSSAYADVGKVTTSADTYAAAANLIGYMTHSYDKWVNVCAEYERIPNGDESYSVRMNKFYYDGISRDVSAVGFSTIINWWEKTSASTFSLKPGGESPIKFDNILIYEPLESGIENVDLINKKLDIRNLSTTDAITGKLIIAGYDSSNNLVSIKSDVSVNVSANTTSSDILFTLPEGSGIASYKFFVWDGFDNCTPCVNMVEATN